MYLEGHYHINGNGIERIYYLLIHGNNYLRWLPRNNRYVACEPIA